MAHSTRIWLGINQAALLLLLLRLDAKEESLKAAVWLPKKAINISNVVCSGGDKHKDNWLTFWAEQTQRDSRLQECAAVGCTHSESKGDTMVGGHVWVEGQQGVGHCYIVPICHDHNTKRKYDFPHWFAAKPDATMVRITARREFVESRCKPGKDHISGYVMRERQGVCPRYEAPAQSMGSSSSSSSS